MRRGKKDEGTGLAENGRGGRVAAARRFSPMLLHILGSSLVFLRRNGKYGDLTFVPSACSICKYSATDYLLSLGGSGGVAEGLAWLSVPVAADLSLLKEVRPVLM